LALSRHVACGRLDASTCLALVDLGMSRLPDGHPPVLALAADYDCPPGARCEVGFGAIVAARYLGGEMVTVNVVARGGWEPGRPVTWIRVGAGYAPPHVAQLLPGA
jgi:hypothetical protein